MEDPFHARKDLGHLNGLFFRQISKRQHARRSIGPKLEQLTLCPPESFTTLTTDERLEACKLKVRFADNRQNLKVTKMIEVKLLLRMDTGARGIYTPASQMWTVTVFRAPLQKVFVGSRKMGTSSLIILYSVESYPGDHMPPLELEFNPWADD